MLHLFVSEASAQAKMCIRDRIYEAVWDKDGEHCGTAVASVIGQIRRKLTPDTPKGGYIRTVLGSGYKFNSSPF